MVGESDAPTNRFQIVVPRRFPFADPYRVFDESGALFCEVPGGRWFYRDLRICDPEGAELARLHRIGRWWLPEAAFDLLSNDTLRVQIHMAKVTMADGEELDITARRRWRQCEFKRGGRVVARFARRKGHPDRHKFDLEMASDQDAISMVGVWVARDQARRQWIALGW